MMGGVGRGGRHGLHSVAWSGLALLVLFNAGVLALLGFEAYQVATYRTRSGTTVTAVEAAWIGALWTKVLAGAALLTALNVLGVGIALAHRLNRLHRLQASAAAETAAVLEEIARARSGVTHVINDNAEPLRGGSFRWVPDYAVAQRPPPPQGRAAEGGAG